MSSPTELTESLRSLHEELVKMGDFDAHASRHRALVQHLYHLALMVERLEVQMDVIMKLIGDRKHK